MSVDIGIIGLPKSGRTTIFNALTKGKANTQGYSSQGKAPNIGIAKVPDARLKILTDMFHPKKVVNAEVKYIDVGASLKELSAEKGIGGQLLNELGKVDELINVARAFNDPAIPHPAGSVDVDRDIANMDMELTFSDLAMMERRLEKIEQSMKSAKPQERGGYVKEKELLTKIKEKLEGGTPIRELPFTQDEQKTLQNYQFLTSKPMLIIVNIGEDQLPQAAKMEQELGARYARPKCKLITLCGKLEAEIAQLDDAEAADLLKMYGIKEPGLGRVISQSYELLGMISFLTVGEDEVRAWPVPDGFNAQKAAGKIHSDLEKGFIRAEVVSYDDLIKTGSMAEAKKKGLFRLEGKEYPVKDGDIMNILFNV